MTPSAGRGVRHARVRCAIYTRKSSEEGLEQEFNSLQAQREACEAFIDSQRHEGWVCLPAGYDDGGFSGATMERPALQRLLADIIAGRVDTVVVYKIDRLTRSLADFAKSAVYKKNQWLTVSNLAKSYHSISNTYIGECLT
jgi:site-specific DNA recombinase